MKNLLLLFAISSTPLCFANKFVYTVEAKDLNNLREEVEKTIPKIKSGKLKSIRHSRLNCILNQPKHIKIKSVIINEIYRLNSKGKLYPVYFGDINYFQKNCHKS